MIGNAFTQAGIAAMRLLAFLPLPVIRALGRALGWFLYAFVGSRRRVVQTNLALCFPELSGPARQRLTRQTFIFFAQAWLDRAWLWHAPLPWVRRRLTVTGAVDELLGTEPTVIFAPHFVGINAGWAALALQTGAALVPASCERLARGRGYVLRIGPALRVDEALVAAQQVGASRAELLALVTRINQAVEEIVISLPGQYLWAYARYKTPRSEAGLTQLSTHDR